VPSGFRVEDPTSRKSPPKQSLDGAPSRHGYGITRLVYNVRRFWTNCRSPSTALNAGFSYVALTATRRKSPPKRSLDGAPSWVFLPQLQIPRSDRDDIQMGEREPSRFKAEDPRPCKKRKDRAPAYR
jgi:hypothetical protein